MNPYLVLGVSRDADDETIRAAYLRAIRLASPESSPQRFKEVAAAYEHIRDEKRRCEYALFNTESPAASPLDVLVQFARATQLSKPPRLETLREILKSCAKS